MSGSVLWCDVRCDGKMQSSIREHQTPRWFQKKAVSLESGGRGEVYTEELSKRWGAEKIVLKIMTPGISLKNGVPLILRPLILINEIPEGGGWETYKWIRSVV